ncbi:hypothetical protein BCU68_01475 [Vibrio sp. 10N.286.49.B3]|uniref:hypothetical protein n=1 Tax=Vibrio sp. 10N.286.49.B3 TaxID=1880855 RepID=UPI000C867669|nr:hypothetical protein [Vibrio sp. 10N.286.49.B3]PMH46733.1 hypothetical protein BCU68_01475 [Vibrio sp. 10N.286.49.B3]
MEMIIISSEQQKRMMMIFSKTTSNMSDKVLLNNIDDWEVKSQAYPAFKAARDHRVERVTLSENPFLNKDEAGDFLYLYLKKGYICLGNLTGDPKPNLAPWGVRSVRKLKNIGFGL